MLEAVNGPAGGVTREMVGAVEKLIEDTTSSSAFIDLVLGDALTKARELCDRLNFVLDMEEKAMNDLPTAEQVEAACVAAGLEGNPF